MSSDIESWPPPDDSTAFESLCLDLWSDIWCDPSAQKNGRSGQPQAGVDVFGKLNGKQVGLQCKQKDGLLRSKLTVAELEQEIEEAKKFQPALASFIIATTGPRDARTQERARILSEEHKAKRLFSIEVWTWKDIWHELYRRPELFKRIAPTYWPRLTVAQGHSIQGSPNLTWKAALGIVSVVVLIGCFWVFFAEYTKPKQPIPSPNLTLSVGFADWPDIEIPLTNDFLSLNLMMEKVMGGKSGSVEFLGELYLPYVGKPDTELRVLLQNNSETVAERVSVGVVFPDHVRIIPAQGWFMGKMKGETWLSKTGTNEHAFLYWEKDAIIGDVPASLPPFKIGFPIDQDCPYLSFEIRCKESPKRNRIGFRVVGWSNSPAKPFLAKPVLLMAQTNSQGDLFTLMPSNIFDLGGRWTTVTNITTNQLSVPK